MFRSGSKNEYVLTYHALCGRICEVLKMLDTLITSHVYKTDAKTFIELSFEEERNAFLDEIYGDR